MSLKSKLFVGIVLAVVTSVRSASVPLSFFNIHPWTLENTVNDESCVGVLGGVLSNGAQVDIYHCNASPTQMWSWVGNTLVQVDSVTGTQYCLDAGNVDEITNGVKLKVWECYAGLPQQTWNHPTLNILGDSGTIALSVDNKCMDLTDASSANQNVLQVWDCVEGDLNQKWSIEAVAATTT